MPQKPESVLVTLLTLLVGLAIVGMCISVMQVLLPSLSGRLLSQNCLVVEFLDSFGLGAGAWARMTNH